MSPAARWGLTAMGVAVAVALLAVGTQRMLERQRTTNEINRLREELYRERAAAERCRGSLDTSEMALRMLGLTIDSMRSRVDSFEAMDGRGVPAARYDEYLDLFDSYNDSVEAWEGRERRLRAAETSCRATIERHNALSDSLQAVLIEAGIDAGQTTGG